MAKHGKVSPARRPRDDDDSILLRSAETIGRVIGTLQRQLDGARGRFSEFVLDKGIGSHDGNGSRPKHKIARKKSAATTRKVSTPAKNTTGAATSVGTRKATAKSAGVRKAAKSAGVRKATKSTSGRKGARH